MNIARDERFWPLVCRPLARDSRLMMHVMVTWYKDVATDYSAGCRARSGLGRRIRKPSRSHAFDSAMPAEHTGEPHAGERQSMDGLAGPQRSVDSVASAV
jgi:hypothetical protein